MTFVFFPYPFSLCLLLRILPVLFFHCLLFYYHSFSLISPTTFPTFLVTVLSFSWLFLQLLSVFFLSFMQQFRYILAPAPRPWQVLNIIQTAGRTCLQDKDHGHADTRSPAEYNINTESQWQGVLQTAATGICSRHVTVHRYNVWIGKSCNWQC